MGGTGAADHSCKGTLYLGVIPVHCKMVGGRGGGVPLPPPPPPPTPTPMHVHVHTQIHVQTIIPYSYTGIVIKL